MALVPEKRVEALEQLQRALEPEVQVPVQLQAQEQEQRLRELPVRLVLVQEPVLEQVLSLLRVP